MAGEARSVGHNRALSQKNCEKALAYLKRACPSLAEGLAEGLKPLPDGVLELYLNTLVVLVRAAPEGWKEELGDFNDPVPESYRRNERRVGHLRLRSEFCGLRTDCLLEQIEMLREADTCGDDALKWAYALAVSRLVHFLGFLVRAEARIYPAAKRATPPSDAPKRLAQVLHFPTQKR